jgi:hypothetical protein
MVEVLIISSAELEIISLLSVTLTHEKQMKLEEEFKRYADAVNYVIRAIMQEHYPTAGKTITEVQDDFAERFGRRVEYLQDITKSARVTIGQHRRMANLVRTMRGKMPRFREGKMIFSEPIVKLDSKGIRLFITRDDVLPIPFDKHSRNAESDILEDLERSRRRLDRIRLTRHREGFVELDVRVIG